jgi:hypothetical protein
MALMIRADDAPLADPTVDPAEDAPTRPRRRAKATRNAANALNRQAFAPPTPVPSWARLSGRAGQGEPSFAAGASLALLDARLRLDPPFAGALGQRLARMSAGTSAKLLRLRADEAALRDLSFAESDDPSPAARLLRLWRDLARRPPGLDAARIVEAAARLDLKPPDPAGLAAGLGAVAQGPHDPAAAAARAAALIARALPDAPSPETEVLALWAADLLLAVRLRWRRPLPLVAAKILDPGLRPPDAGTRLRPGDAAWEKRVAAAIALAAAAALDLAVALARRAEALLAVAPKLRAKPSARVVDLIFAEDCLSPAEAARRAAMTDRAARRLFDRLLALGAVGELTGRPIFRLYGL